MLYVLTAIVVSTAFTGAAWIARTRDFDIWLIPYLKQLLARRRLQTRGPTHIMLCVADHFEPQGGAAGYEHEVRRMDEWMSRYPALASRHRDFEGRPHQHTFFYPEEEYRPEHLDRLTELCRRGFGDVEVHLHHDHDTPEGLAQKLTTFVNTLHQRHGLLHRDLQSGRIQYGFIHGNWALDNSDGGKWCGVNNELDILAATGCYADFTLPSTPSRTQTRKINSIYYAQDDPCRPKSHDTGVDVEVGRTMSGTLMIVQGPLALNFRSRKFGVIPRVENGELSGDNPPSSSRADLWVRQGVHVKGRPEWIFIKLHTHGANDKNIEALLGAAMDETLLYIETVYNDGAQYCLHYVTAREMYNIIKAAEAGASGNPAIYRDGQNVAAGAAATV